ncbi:butyrate--CoA ligase AAE11, peroxisomal-like protein, partial [Tanacetum coccineum]
MNILQKCLANYVPLTPLTFIKRASIVYSNRTSVVYAGVEFTWRQTYERCCRLASSLRFLNIVKNDVVSVLAPNVPALYEMHFGVPMAGGVLNAINTRLDARNIATILRHSEAKIFFVYYEYTLRLLRMELKEFSIVEDSMPLVIVIDDIDTPTGVRLGKWEYELLINQGNPQYHGEELEDEWDVIALNYTSGTTANPKGVVYSHRAAKGGTNVCLRKTTAEEMYMCISDHKVTHMCCAPVVLNIFIEAKPHERREITAKINILTGGAPPPAALLETMEDLGFHVMHAYGLIEATGPALVCEWQAKWNKLPKDHQARLKARQGETAKAFQKGWFWTRDVGVIHTEGYIEIKDRSKDVIIPGGENISSVEIEFILFKHPTILETAVVAMPHPRWGESPCAFVVLKKSGSTTESEILAYCLKHMSKFMVPKKVEFVNELPRTGT